MTAPVNISVLVPVYNVEPYLAQCLESICSQTLRELEIVCVDDASTDGSLSILREFAERDPRVKVVQAPENGGLSRSRNLAMSHAVGEYLFLVDSDDWLETDLLEEMYRRAKALDADRLACGFRYYYESAPDREDRFLPEDMAPPEKGWLPCTPETIGKIHHGAGGMMIRRSIVEKHGIRFPEGLPVKTCISITPFFHGAGGFASSAGRLTFTASGPDPLPAVLRPAVPSSRWIT